MAERDETYKVRIRKPIAEPNGVLGYGDDCFRLGRLGPNGTPHWDYEIPFSEIAQVEHKVARDIVRGKLRDGTEFEFRFGALAYNPAKTIRQAEGLRDALGKVAVAEGGSLRAVDSDDSDDEEAPDPGCMGCTTTAALVSVVLGVAALVVVVRSGR